MPIVVCGSVAEMTKAVTDIEQQLTTNDDHNTTKRKRITIQIDFQ